MSPEQLTELLIGLAEVQAEVIAAVAQTVEPNRVPSELQQKLSNTLFHLAGGHDAEPTLRTLSARALLAKLAPGSNAEGTLEQRLQEDLTKLLR